MGNMECGIQNMEYGIWNRNMECYNEMIVYSISLKVTLEVSVSCMVTECKFCSRGFNL
jgi:hypothetical protein